MLQEMPWEFFLFLTDGIFEKHFINQGFIEGNFVSQSISYFKTVPLQWVQKNLNKKSKSEQTSAEQCKRLR